jgi:signal transduction histidine kinase
LKFCRNQNFVSIRTEIVENQAFISISDNGKGMTEEVKSRIFDHLFTTKGVGKGTGLGLAIARQIVEDKHNGKLSVESQIGQGTTFSILLPIAA